MNNDDLQKKKMSRETMLAKIEDVLKHGNLDDPPAYTLVLGAGASSGVIPTAREMLGLPDTKTEKIHDKSIPLWLAKQRSTVINTEADRLECSKKFWKRFNTVNALNSKCGAVELDLQGLPTAGSIATAYQSVFNTSCIEGLDTPERHRKYMREVTMTASPGTTQLNATHFYLASLLSLQKRSGEAGAGNKPLYTGRREFARTIFTTNFDPLLQTSLQLFQLLYYMTDRPEFLSADALQTDEHPAIHLFYAHGSVHRPYMANTDGQIALLKQQNARDLAAYLGNHGVIVLGYSGWDDCLLEALNQTKTFSNNLYWLARREQSISESVANFLCSHHNAYWVEIDDAGNFMADLHSHLCPGAPNTEMLYNPIRNVLCQLECVNLENIQAGGVDEESNVENALPISDAPKDVETIRQQVIARLKDAQKFFSAPAKEKVDWKELERQSNLSYANNDWGAAWIGYNRLLEQEVNLPIESKALALFRRGYCYSKKGEGDKAVIDYTAVIELPNAPTEQIAKARTYRAYYYLEKGDKDRGAADCTAVIELPGAPSQEILYARFNRGVYFSEKGKMDAAIADYTAVIEMPGALVEQLTKARVNRGVCYIRKKNPDDAIIDFSAVIELPNSPIDQIAKAKMNRGICYGLKGNVDKEIADYTAIIEMPSAPIEQIANARIYRAICFRDKGETAKAIEDCTSVINLSGASAEQIEKAERIKNQLENKK